MGSCPSNQILLKFKEVYIHANQHFHVAKQCQQIIGLHEPWLYLRLSEKKGRKDFIGDIDFRTSVHFISEVGYHI